MEQKDDSDPFPVNPNPRTIKIRDRIESPVPLEPGRLTPGRLTLQDVNPTFRSGHRFIVQVQSTWFPLVDRNPQTFAVICHAKEVRNRSEPRLASWGLARAVTALTSFRRSSLQGLSSPRSGPAVMARGSWPD